MTAIDNARNLAKLSRNNPEFITKYSYTIKQLDSLCRTDSTDREEAKNLIGKLSGIRAGITYKTVQNAYVQFITGMVQNRKDSVILEDVSVSELIEARRIAYGFLKMADKTVGSGMHTDRNEFIKVYIKSVAQNYVTEVKANSEEQWDKFKELETVVIRALTHHMLYREDISPLLQVFELGYKLQNSVYKSNEKYMNRMNLFDVAVKEDKLNEMETLNELKYLFIKDLNEFKKYYSDLKNRMDKMLESKELTGEEYNYYNSKFPSTYASLIDDRPCKYYVPICAYQYILVNKDNINHMLSYTQEEMFTAYKFAFKFCKFYSNKIIKELVIDYIEIQQKYAEAAVGKKLAREAFIGNAESCLDLLQKCNIITPMDYCKYAEKYKLG